MQEFGAHPPMGPPPPVNDMSVSFRCSRTSRGSTSFDASDGGEAEVGDACPPFPIDQDVRLRR